jgi:hypothetical protein
VAAISKRPPRRGAGAGRRRTGEGLAAKDRSADQPAASTVGISLQCLLLPETF